MMIIIKKAENDSCKTRECVSAFLFTIRKECLAIPPVNALVFFASHEQQAPNI